MSYQDLNKGLDDAVTNATNELRSLISQRSSLGGTVSPSTPASGAPTISSSHPTPQSLNHGYDTIGENVTFNTTPNNTTLTSAFTEDCSSRPLRPQSTAPAQATHNASPIPIPLSPYKPPTQPPHQSHTQHLENRPPQGQIHFSPGQREALFDSKNSNNQSHQIPKSQFEKMHKKLQLLSDKMKAAEKEDSKVVAALQKNEALILQLLETQKSDRATIAALRREVHFLHKHVEESSKKDVARAQEMDELVREGFCPNEQISATLVSTIAQIVSKRITAEQATISNDIKRACMLEQGKVLKEWTSTVKTAIDQRADPWAGLQDELMEMNSRLLTVENKVLGPDSFQRDANVLRLCRDELKAAVGSLIEKFNTICSRMQQTQQESIQVLNHSVESLTANVARMQMESTLSQSELKAHFDRRVAALEFSTVEERNDINCGLSMPLVSDLAEKQEQIQARLQEFSAAFVGLGAVKQSIDFILLELERKTRIDEGKDQALLDSYFNFEQGMATMNDIHDRLNRLEGIYPGGAAVKHVELASQHAQVQYAAGTVSGNSNEYNQAPMSPNPFSLNESFFQTPADEDELGASAQSIDFEDISVRSKVVIR